MKRLFIVLIVFIALVFPVGSFAQNFPSPVGAVNDFGDIYTWAFRNELETDLTNFKQTSGNAIVVATIKSLDGSDIESYANKLFEKWKIGDAKLDNGLLVLIAPAEKEVRIEVGYGLEPYVTDGRAGGIIRSYMVPKFRQNDYEGGTREAVNQLKRILLAKEIAPTVNPNQSAQKDKAGLIISLLFLGIFFVGPYLAAYLGRTKTIWPGGLIGGLFGAFGGWILAGLITGGILALTGAVLGLLLDVILSKNYQYRKKNGMSTDFFTSGGGFRGGGWGGGSGGGFGGFGGGSSGGGGASGRW